MRFSPKILGLNVGMFYTVFGQSRIVLRIGFGSKIDPLCVLVFRAVFCPS